MNEQFLSSEPFRNVPQSSEEFGNLPPISESFGNVPNPSETFRKVRKVAEKTEQHTFTVREVARLFEQAGVPRTERSIINWCNPNRQGVARLDAYFEEADGRYFITPQSVSRAIEEEKAKRTAPTESPVEMEVRKDSETHPLKQADESDRMKELLLKNRDVEIATRAKDLYIEQLEKDRGQSLERMIGMSRYVGELETQVFQLGGAPRGNSALPQNSEHRDRPRDY